MAARAAIDLTALLLHRLRGGCHAAAGGGRVERERPVRPVPVVIVPSPKRSRRPHQRLLSPLVPVRMDRVGPGD